MKLNKLTKQLSDLVVTRKVAQQLNPLLDKAGIEITPNFWWYEGELIIKLSTGSYHNISNNLNKMIDWSNWSDRAIPTYLLEEVLGVLPGRLEVGGDIYRWKMMDDGIYYTPLYKTVKLEKGVVLFGSLFLASDGVNKATNAAKLLIWAIENGYVGGEK